MGGQGSLSQGNLFGPINKFIMGWKSTLFGSMFCIQGPSVTVDQRDAGILIEFVIRYSFASFSSHTKKIEYPMIAWNKICSDILESSDFARNCVLYAT